VLVVPTLNVGTHTNRARKLKFGVPVDVCGCRGEIKICPLGAWGSAVPNFYIGTPSYTVSSKLIDLVCE